MFCKILRVKNQSNLMQPSDSQTGYRIKSIVLCKLFYITYLPSICLLIQYNLNILIIDIMLMVYRKTCLNFQSQPPTALGQMDMNLKLLTWKKLIQGISIHFWGAYFENYLEITVIIPSFR